MDFVFLILSFIVALRNIIRSKYALLSKEELKQKRLVTIEKLLKKNNKDVKEIQDLYNGTSVISTVFFITYVIWAACIMGYPFIFYYVAVLIVLKIARSVHIYKFFVNEEVKKSWSSVLYYVLSFAFSSLYIAFYFLS